MLIDTIREYLNTIYQSIVRDRFLYTTQKSEIVVEQYPFPEFDKNSPCRESAYYCRIPIDDSSWFSINASSVDQLIRFLERRPTADDSNITPTHCVKCDSTTTSVTPVVGFYCSTTWIPYVGIKQRKYVCGNCASDVAEKILESDDFDEMSVEEYVSGKI